MVVLTHMPKPFGASRRERRLEEMLSRWMFRSGRRWAEMDDPAAPKAIPFGEMPVGLVVVKGPDDLSRAAAFRNRFPHGRLVAVVLHYDPDLLVMLQRYSPCFTALSELDDAAIPEVLERLRTDRQSQDTRREKS